MRSRISWLVLATTSAVSVAFDSPLCRLVRTRATHRPRSAADQAARNVALVLSGTERTAELDGYLSDLNRSIVPQVAVLTPNGRSLGTSDDLRQDPDVRRALTGEGLQVTDEDGGAVLIPVDVRGGTAVVRASVTEDDLRRGVAGAWAGIIGLGLVLLLLGLVIARQLGRRISEPLREVAQTAHQLREGDLGARADVRGTPETEELARALNGLAERTTELLAAERAAAGDLSHRLRTPVTALRLDAESVPDPALAQRLQDHITVLQLTVDQIVKEARRPVQSELAARSDAARTVAERVAFWSPLAEDDRRPLHADVAPGPLVVPVSESDLADLLDVLVDNVFAHTPEGTGFTVSLRAAEATCVLVVADDGPGWSEAPTSRAGHTGLGLDIARRTAAQCGGHLVTGTTAGGGARVEVALPLAD
jgi:signal transduction histidine kinase